MFNYTLKIEMPDGDVESIEYSSVGPIDMHHLIEIPMLMGKQRFRVVSVCHCDKGVILSIEKVH